MPKIIISYRRADTLDVAMRIRDQLAQRYGKESVFTDIDSIPIGSDFLEHITSEIATCDVLIAIVGPRWLSGGREQKSGIESATDYVRIEVESALKQRVSVVPVVVSGARMPEPSELPEAIRTFAHRNAATVDSGLNFQTDLDRLCRSLDKLFTDKQASHTIPRTAAVEPSQPAAQKASEGPLPQSAGNRGNSPRYRVVSELIDWLAAARRAVPAIDFLIGAACVGASVALVLGFLGHARTSAIIFCTIVAAMALAIMASHALLSRNPGLALAGRATLWAVTLFFLSFLLVTASAWAFKSPTFVASLLGLEEEEAAICSHDAEVAESYSCGFGDYVVQNIRLNDEDHGLWIRDTPDMSGLKEMLIPPNGIGVSASACDSSAQWCKIQCNEKSGFSKRIYLGPRSQAIRVVTGLSPNEATGLLVRSGPDATCRRIGSLSNSREVVLHGCQPNHLDGRGPTWCLITYSNVSGWIPDGYLRLPN